MTSTNTVLTVNLGDRSYPIEIGASWLRSLGSRVRDALARTCGLLVVSDSNVAALYGETALQSLRDAGFDAELSVVAAGENSKSYDVLSFLYDALLRRKISRQGAVVALGGGVVGDLAGFAAATYLRGIDFIQVPTSLVAMVDSSVGGKTGINHPAGKNLIGAFWQPRLVFVDTELLQTLPKRELVSGMGEVVKHGVIRDRDYFDFVEKNVDSILAVEASSMATVVEGSCRIKAGVVGEDEREVSGIRAFLNFGHTVGHALEAIAGYGTLCHGEAVAIGMVATGQLAVQKGLWTEADQDRLVNLLVRYGLPTRIPPGLDMNAVMSTMHLDKKVKEGRVRFVLPTQLGAVALVDDVRMEDVRAICDDLVAR